LDSPYANLRVNTVFPTPEAPKIAIENSNAKEKVDRSEEKISHAPAFSFMVVVKTKFYEDLY
jgi:hypothetical protein